MPSRSPAFTPIQSSQRRNPKLSLDLFSTNTVFPGPSAEMLQHPNPTSTIAVQEFEPVLNVPALAVFVFIGVVFAGLQIRVRQIEAAVTERTDKLKSLRDLKRRSYEKSELSDDVDRALLDYELAYRKVENLRSILPGVNLRAPINQKTAIENEMAAQQFLNITSQPPEPESDSEGTAAKIALVVLSFIGLFQIALLGFFATMNDPMMMESIKTL